MLKSLAAAATATLLLTGASFGDGTGHSHAHTHPHTGHAVDYGYQHSHDETIDGQHSHEINGQVVRHTHRPVKGFNEKIAYRERRARGRYQKGAGFGPYSLAEYQVRYRFQQPGTVRIQEPWPTRRWRRQ